MVFSPQSPYWVSLKGIIWETVKNWHGGRKLELKPCSIIFYGSRTMPAMVSCRLLRFQIGQFARATGGKRCSRESCYSATKRICYVLFTATCTRNMTELLSIDGTVYVTGETAATFARSFRIILCS